MSAYRKKTKSEINTTVEPVDHPSIEKRELPKLDLEPKNNNPSETARKLSSVSLTVFLRSKKKRIDQSAGFMAHCRINKLGARTIPEWEDAWSQFMSKPVW